MGDSRPADHGSGTGAVGGGAANVSSSSSLATIMSSPKAPSTLQNLPETLGFGSLFKGCGLQRIGGQATI